jgi:hypothetical protein
MNQLAIELNNLSVGYLKKGDMAKAFELISKASQVVMKGVSVHRHADAGSDVFRFHWEDCSKARMAMNEKRNSLKGVESSSWEGSTPYLFLRGLRITINFESDVSNEDIEAACACSFAWVIWFNQAMICSIIGTMLNERGNRLLELSFDLYRRVLIRIEAEEPSKHWNTLLMGVLNNQACIYNDFQMFLEMRERLELLAGTILASKEIDQDERRDFCLNLQVLGSRHLAPAA